MQRLNSQTLRDLNSAIKKPDYPYLELPIGILHFGMGNFHRAHQAVFTEDAIECYFAKNKRVPAWGICGINLRSRKSKEELDSQNGLYSLTEQSTSHSKTRVIGCMREVLFAPEDYSTIYNYFADPKITVITLTVTEKGYCHTPATGSLQLEHPDIQHDLQNWNKKLGLKSIIGYIAAGLFVRYQNKETPFVVMSCDNLPSNGKLLRKLIIEFSEKIDKPFASFVAEKVKFPNTMVDRITPALQEKDYLETQERLGVVDKAAVMTEKYKEWVIQDLDLALPDWNVAGARVTSRVADYEIQKLRLLNGCHSALAYLGCLSRYEYIYETLLNKKLKTFAEEFLAEVTPTVPVILERDVEQYKKDILSRFANQKIKYRCAQVAMDGSQKLPQRLLNSLRDCLVKGLPYQNILRAIAAWMHYVTQEPVKDPLAEQFSEIAQRAQDDSTKIVEYLLKISTIFGTDLVKNEKLKRELILMVDQFRGPAY